MATEIYFYNEQTRFWQVDCPSCNQWSALTARRADVDVLVLKTIDHISAKHSKTARR